jgi:hypothetical protein
MTTPLDQGTVFQPADADPPIWQPPLLASDPLAPERLALESHASVDDAPQGDPPVVQVAPATRRPPARRANSVTALLLISSMVALGGVAFAVGRVTSGGQSGTGQTTTDNALAGQNGLPGVAPNASGQPNFDLAGRDGGGFGAGTISGTVTGITSTSITIKEANGQTVTVATGSSTAYHSQTAATSSDVTTGATVTIQTTGTGATTTSGSASASASPGTTTTRTATDVTITAK